MAGNRNSGRRRKPDAVRSLHNSRTRKHHRERPEPTYSIEIPTAPASLSGEARTEWDRITALLHEQKLITHVDLAVVASYSTLYGLQEQIRTQMQAPDFKLTVTEFSDSGLRVREHPLVKMLRQVTQQTRAYLTELGLTPASRSKVSPGKADPTEGEDEFDKLASQLGGKVVSIAAGRR